MRKTKTVETIEEYDENGKLTRRSVTETEETDDNPARFEYRSIPSAQDTQTGDLPRGVVISGGPYIWPDTGTCAVDCGSETVAKGAKP